MQIHWLNGAYFLVYTAADAQGVLSIGLAKASNVFGPYEDPIGEPIVRNTGKDPLGVIDPTLFVHEGTSYLLWKDDGNAVERPTPIWIQQLTQDGLSRKGTAHELIRNNKSSWEGDVVEAPWMVRRNGYFYLFYSVHAGPCNAHDMRHKQQLTTHSVLTPSATCTAGQLVLHGRVRSGCGTQQIAHGSV